MTPRASHVALGAGVACMAAGIALSRLAVGVLLEEAKANRLMALADRPAPVVATARNPNLTVHDVHGGERWNNGWGGW